MIEDITLVTGGSGYTDIDVLACACAYAQLLNLSGTSAKAILAAPYNETVPKSVRKWPYQYETTDRKHHTMTRYVLVDISNPDYFPHFVDHNCIVEVYDHRYGYEDYWKQKLKNNAHIEFIGSCATLIWEAFKKRKKENNISTVNANLLYTAIFSNTLVLQSNITTERDEAAFNDLKHIISLPPTWIRDYYEEIAPPNKAISLDKKFSQIGDKIFSIGQIELWSTDALLAVPNIVKTAKQILEPHSALWFLTIPCISLGINHFITTSKEVKKMLRKTIDVTFEGDIGYSKTLFLRKEIEKALREKLKECQIKS
jgi:inorganic pyrophosphatase/exopolyphosphatase